MLEFEPRPRRGFELRGLDFGAPGSVLIGGERAIIRSWRSDRILGTLPEGRVGVVDLVIVSGTGTVIYKDRVEAGR